MKIGIDHKELYDGISKRIVLCREDKGILSSELADMLGISRSTMLRYEKGQIDRIPLAVIEKMADILDVNPLYLMGWSDDPNRRQIRDDTLVGDEIKLLDAWRDADPIYRTVALDILKSHKA